MPRLLHASLGATLCFMSVTGWAASDIPPMTETCDLIPGIVTCVTAEVQPADYALCAVLPSQISFTLPNNPSYPQTLIVPACVVIDGDKSKNVPWPKIVYYNSTYPIVKVGVALANDHIIATLSSNQTPGALGLANTSNPMYTLQTKANDPENKYCACGDPNCTRPVTLSAANSVEGDFGVGNGYKDDPPFRTCHPQDPGPVSTAGYFVLNLYPAYNGTVQSSTMEIPAGNYTATFNLHLHDRAGG